MRIRAIKLVFQTDTACVVGLFTLAYSLPQRRDGHEMSTINLNDEDAMARHDSNGSYTIANTSSPKVR